MLFFSWRLCASGVRFSSNNSSSNSYESNSYVSLYVYGCTDASAINYNSSANKDDGSCIAKVLGCIDKKADKIVYTNKVGKK